MSFEGYVEKINYRDGAKKNGSKWFQYSFKLDGDAPWISLAFDQKPAFAEGQYISCDTEVNAKGYHTIKAGTGKIIDKPAREQAPKSPAKGKGGYSGGGGGGSSEYWAKKFEHELKNVEPRITLTSARRDALDFLKLVAEHDALPLTATKTKAGEATRFDQLSDFLDKVTVKFFLDANDPTRLTEGVQDERDQPAAAPTPAPISTVPEQEDTSEDDSLDDDIPF